MDAAPFRQFLSSKVYASKEDLSEAVGVDKGADAFCTWVLDLRLEWRSRRSVGEYIQQRDRQTVNCLPDQWFRVAEQEIFNIWSVLGGICLLLVEWRPTLSSWLINCATLRSVEAGTIL